MNKSDFLKECISDPALVPSGQPVPMDAFMKAYCVRCDNRECSRAGSNNMLFDRRVRNWQNDLFEKPPRADDSDPRFVQIRAKNFAPAGPSAPGVGSSNFVSVGARVEAPRPVPAETPVPAVQSEPEPPPAAVEEPAVAPVPAEAMKSIPNVYSSTGASNTPFQQGAFLPGAPTEPAKEKVMEAGSTFVFGEDE